MSNEQDPRLERFWAPPNDLPSREDDEERMRGFIEHAEEHGRYAPDVIAALKKLMERR